MPADVLIVGGGPAGMMAGLLFARAGVTVRVLEKHADFFRDFRGDTVHPSTMEILDQLGMLERFLERPHDRARHRPHPRRGARLCHRRPVAPRHPGAVHRDDAAMGFPRLPARRGGGLPRLHARHGGAGRPASSRKAGASSAFGLRDGARASRRQAGDRRRRPLVAGPAARPAAGRDARRADGRVLVPPAAGRASRRGAARIDRHRADGRADRPPHLLASAPSSSPRAAARQIKARGIDWIAGEVAKAFPDIDFSGEGGLRSTADLHLLEVALDRLTCWHRPGPAGDRRRRPCHVADRRDRHQPRHPGCGRGGQHPRRPAGRGERRSIACCTRSRTRRLFPTRIIQAGQKAAQDAVIGRVLGGAPITARARGRCACSTAIPLLRRIPGRMIGLGIRRERVRSPNAYR